MIDLATGYIKNKFLGSFDEDNRLKTESLPIHKISTKTDVVAGKENEQIIVRDVDALAYFDVDVETPAAFDTLVSTGQIRIINDGKAV